MLAAIAAWSPVEGRDPSVDIAAFRVNGDAIPEPLGGLRGDAGRGRTIVLDREVGNCLICHAVPDPSEAFQGELGPPLQGVGSRLSEGQLRLRIVDQTRLNPETIMPPYHRVEDLTNVAPRHRGKPALSAQEVEDVVAYLASLRE
jgi:sulfur-oxidizing protein SoxX